MVVRGLLSVDPLTWADSCAANPSIRASLLLLWVGRVDLEGEKEKSELLASGKRCRSDERVATVEAVTLMENELRYSSEKC